MFNFKKKTVINAYLKAIQWIKKNTLPEQGITLSSKRKIPYLEVTGYLIPTLINVGELKLAKQYAEFLSYMQRPNGSFAGPDGKEYPFDTGQALKGLISASKIWPKFKSPAKKAADYLIANISRKGKIKVDYKDINEGVIVYTLPALKQAGQSFKNKKYFKKAQLSVAYYKNHSGVLSVNQLTHFLAYTIDGFMEMGEMQLVKPVVKRIFRQQRKDGSIPAYPKASWVCTPGLAQLAIIAYKMKMREKADKAINYLNDVQNKTGGWFGSYGTNPGYFPNEEISWTNKFFLDAVILKIASFFNEKALIFPKEIENQDPRLKILFREIPSLKNKKILDVGCGKGRFAKKIKANEFQNLSANEFRQILKNSMQWPGFNLDFSLRSK